MSQVFGHVATDALATTEAKRAFVGAIADITHQNASFVSILSVNPSSGTSSVYYSNLPSGLLVVYQIALPSSISAVQANMTFFEISGALDDAVNSGSFLRTLLVYFHNASISSFDNAIVQKPTLDLQPAASATANPAQSSSSGASSPYNKLSGGAVAAIVICVLVVTSLAAYVAHAWITRAKSSPSAKAQSVLSPGARVSRSSAITPSPRKAPSAISLDVASPVTSPYGRPSARPSAQKGGLFAAIRDSLSMSGPKKSEDLGVGLAPEML